MGKYSCIHVPLYIHEPRFIHGQGHIRRQVFIHALVFMFMGGRKATGPQVIPPPPHEWNLVIIGNIHSWCGKTFIHCINPNIHSSLNTNIHSSLNTNGIYTGRNKVDMATRSGSGDRPQHMDGAPFCWWSEAHMVRPSPFPFLSMLKGQFWVFVRSPPFQARGLSGRERISTSDAWERG